MLIAGLLFSMGCKKSRETICENLLEQGVADTSLLQGKWDLEYFAYTLNGEKIKEKDEIKKSGSVEFNPSDSNDVNGFIRVVNTMIFKYDVGNNNYIEIQVAGGTLINPPPEEAKLENRLRQALNNASCYIIKVNELLIYYNHKDDEKNLLILKRI